MSKKYCEKCNFPVVMTELICSSCSGTSFVHKLPDTNYCDCAIPLTNLDSCDRCSRKIAPSRLGILSPKPPKVKNTTPQAVVNNVSQLQAVAGMSNTGKTIDDLIRAQNRTTHAVRAFVRFLFIQLSGFTCAIFLWNLSTAFIDQQKCSQYGSNCTGNGFFQFLAASVLIGSVIWSSQAGWEELGKSEIN